MALPLAGWYPLNLLPLADLRPPFVGPLGLIVEPLALIGARLLLGLVDWYWQLGPPGTLDCDIGKKGVKTVFWGRKRAKCRR